MIGAEVDDQAIRKFAGELLDEFPAKLGRIAHEQADAGCPGCNIRMRDLIKLFELRQAAKSFLDLDLKEWREIIGREVAPGFNVLLRERDELIERISLLERRIGILCADAAARSTSKAEA